MDVDCYELSRSGSGNLTHADICDEQRNLKKIRIKQEKMLHRSPMHEKREGALSHYNFQKRYPKQHQELTVNMHVNCTKGYEFHGII